MDTVFQEAVTKIVTLPKASQREIGMALLSNNAVQHADLPIIAFSD